MSLMGRNSSRSTALANITVSSFQGWPRNEDTVMFASAVLRDEFRPISDMRASADYRRAVLGNLLRRHWLAHQGQRGLRLETLDLEALA